MQTIGLIGGMSWESTAIYYRVANEIVRDRLGGLHSAKLLLSSLDFAEISELQRADRWDTAAAILAEHAAGLERAGADMILICTNTMHLLVDAVQAAVAIPVLHIGDAVADAIAATGLERVGLLGTAFTMEKDFYRARIEDHGLHVSIPNAEERARIHRAIFDELALGVIEESTRAEFTGVIERLTEEGAQGIILGCTEIELLIRPEDCLVPIFPTARIHIEAAVERSLTNR